MLRPQLFFECRGDRFLIRYRYKTIVSDFGKDPTFFIKVDDRFPLILRLLPISDGILTKEQKSF